MKYYLGFHISQIDTHIKGALTECEVNEFGRISNEKILLNYVVFPIEIFLYLRLGNVIITETIKKRNDFSHFDKYYNSLIHPTKLKIAGLYKNNIKRLRDRYNITIAIIATDDKYGKIDVSTQGTWNYSFGQFIIHKSLLEMMIKELNPNVVFPNIWTDIEYRLKKLRPQIQYSDLMKPYSIGINNAIDLILKSPVRVLFSNAFKMLAPTVEVVIKDYINLKGISGIRKGNLSTIAGGITNHQGPYFSKEFKEYLKIILEPLRNLLLHGGVPSESVCNFLILIILEMFEEILSKENS